jgi:hypothetical protein
LGHSGVSGGCRAWLAAVTARGWDAAQTGRIWRCHVCNVIADHDGAGHPPGWYQLRLCGDIPASRDRDPVLGLHCSTDCLAVSILGVYQLSERQVRAWLAGDLVAS